MAGSTAGELTAEMDDKRDYLYELPGDCIAQHPADRRDGSRLLAVGREQREDHRFSAIVDLVPADAVLVVNDTRVIKARLRVHKPSGGAAELLFLEPAGARDGHWRCLARGKKLGLGSELLVDGDGALITVVSARAADNTLIVAVDGDVEALLERHGEVPLPPYIARPDGTSPDDRERYQTVYARAPGAVAAPTAGLHFTHELMTVLGERGCTVTPVTLHVGWGTFAPIRAAADDHEMHAERYVVPAQTAELVASGRPVVAVGTTVVRALESAAVGAHRVRSGAAVTRLFIRRGYDFRVVDQLITNFHLPGSTLLMMVCAFAGYERVMAAYRHAVASGYRFYSYGDAMLLRREVLCQ